MVGKCILIGFRGGGGGGESKEYEEWAMENLATISDISKKTPEETYLEWTTKYFVTSTQGTIPDPGSTETDILEAWAKKYFITTGC